LQSFDGYIGTVLGSGARNVAAQVFEGIPGEPAKSEIMG